MSEEVKGVGEDLAETDQTAVPTEVPAELSDVAKIQQEYMQKCAELGQHLYQEWLHQEEIDKFRLKRQTLFRYMKKLNNKAHALNGEKK